MHLWSQSFHEGPSNLVVVAAKRQSKIERYRQRKELEARLSDVRRVVESGQADDEVSRDFYLLNVQRWISVCLEEIEAIDQEMEILQNMDALKQTPANQSSQPTRRPMKPFILTKDALQVSLCVACKHQLAFFLNAGVQVKGCAKLVFGHFGNKVKEKSFQDLFLVVNF